MMMLDTALRYHHAGLVVLPNDPAKKYPAGLAAWQTRDITEADLRLWFRGDAHAIGVRDQEGIDIDNKGSPGADDLYIAWAELVDHLAPGLVDRLLCERTPSGGYHLVWRCEEIAGNQKLATRPPTADELKSSPKLTAVSLIETRGKGGQFQVSPSPGYELLRGDWCALPTITPAERLILLDCARSLSRSDVRTLASAAKSSERVGDRYNSDPAAADEALALLGAAGWTMAMQRGDALYLTRPGKTESWSATFGFVAPGVLYVFSTNCEPFQEARAYSPFAIMTELAHGGDYKAAAKALHQRYDPKPERVNTKTGEIEPTEYIDAKVDWRTQGATLRELQHKVFDPERWVIEDIGPEGACLMAAKYKSKKSWLSLALGLSVAMGGRALGRLNVSQGRVLYLDLEGRQQRIQKRTRAMLGVQQVEWPDNFHVFTKWPQGDEGMQALEHWFASYPDTALVIIDVLASFRRPMEKHEEFYRYDRDTVDPLNEMGEKHHAMIVLVHHFNKGKHEDVMDSITGSTGLPSAVNTMWALHRDVNDSNITILNMRGRDLENDDPLALKWDSYLNQHVIEGPASEVAISTERKAIMHLLSDDEPRTPKEIATDLGRPVETVKQLLRKLLNDGLIDKPCYGKYARVPKRGNSDHSDHSGNSDHSDHSGAREEQETPKSDRDRARVIAPDTTDHSVLTQQDALNGKSDRSDRGAKGTVDPAYRAIPARPRNISHESQLQALNEARAAAEREFGAMPAEEGDQP